MKVDEQTFIQRYIPLSLLALTVRAMYYGDGAYANGKLTSKQIAEAFTLSTEQVFKLLDMADSMLGLGTTERRLRL